MSKKFLINYVFFGVLLSGSALSFVDVRASDAKTGNVKLTAPHAELKPQQGSATQQELHARFLAITKLSNYAKSNYGEPKISKHSEDVTVTQYSGPLLLCNPHQPLKSKSLVKLVFAEGNDCVVKSIFGGKTCKEFVGKPYKQARLCLRDKEIIIDAYDSRLLTPEAQEMLECINGLSDEACLPLW